LEKVSLGIEPGPSASGAAPLPLRYFDHEIIDRSCKTNQNCGIAEVEFCRSAIASPQFVSVRNSAIVLVVRNIAELRTKLRTAHLCVRHRVETHAGVCLGWLGKI
jgi:hypothetical protein